MAWYYILLLVLAFFFLVLTTDGDGKMVEKMYDRLSKYHDYKDKNEKI